jgi:molybdate transport system ATP-binding protein
MSGGLAFAFEFRRDAFALSVDEQIPAGRVTGVFGASGAGKTTLLRCIAGLETPSAAEIRAGGERWHSSDAKFFLPAHRRRAAYVFQEPRLFPHLDVAGNLDFARSRNRNGRIAREVVVERLQLASLLKRPVQTLSGGQARRVGIARALLRDPVCLLMDEPTVNLDREQRGELLRYLATTIRDLELPVLFVSHDVDELGWLADDLLVLGDGRIHASGSLSAVLSRSDLPVVGGREACVVIETSCAGVDTRYLLSRLVFDGGELLTSGALEQGSQRVRIRADDVSLALEAPASTSVLNVLPATVLRSHRDQEASMLVTLSVGSQPLLSRISLKSHDELGIRPGLSVFAMVKGIAVRGLG